jgi:hypothetical protein
MDYIALKSLIDADPTLTGKSSAEIADVLNAKTVVVDRAIIPSYEIVDATVPAEWAALTSAEKQRYQTITGAGSVNVKGTNTRSAFAAMFGAGTQTRANLLTLQSQTVPLWQQFGRQIDFADVERAMA